MAVEIYMTAEQFIARSFQGIDVKRKTFWLNKEHKRIARQILKSHHSRPRVRYWIHGGRTAWILDEIGKEYPITIGVVIEDGRVKRCDILVYRESRGGEVKYPFFLQQFNGSILVDGNRLNTHIDGITGATLSVRAVTNVTRFALYLHSQVDTNLEGSHAYRQRP